MRTALALLLAGLATGCAASVELERGIERRPVVAADQNRERELVAEGDRLWAERSDPARLAAALARWEAAVAIRDDDWRTYARLARGYFFQADAVFAPRAAPGRYPYDGASGNDPAAAHLYREAHSKGLNAALRGMAARSPAFERKLRAGIGLDRSIELIGADAAALVYWYVANLGRWARATGTGALFRARGALLASLHHLRRIDPAYFHGGADRLLGVYFAAAPALFGGDLERSRAHFRAALRTAPGYHGTEVLAAEFLDRKARDRASFESRLRRVLAPTPDLAPDLAPENAVEREKARALLRRAESYFGR